MPTLPRLDPDLVPPLPANWNYSPGGVGFPTFATNPDSGSPKIGKVNTTVPPNRTLIAHGKDLNSATLVAWAEGGVFSFNPIRTRSGSLQAIIPGKRTISGTSVLESVPNSVMLVWPKNGSGHGAPVRVNAPEIFFLSQERVFKDTKDNELSIFGRNLKLEGSDPYVVVEFNGVSKPVSIIRSKDTELIIRLPFFSGRKEYAPGTYKVFVHNGTGGSLGWSWHKTYTVLANPYENLPIFNVNSYSGTNPIDKLTAAIAAVDTAGGGIIQLASATYTLSGNLNLPDRSSGQPPIILRGAGVRHTFINTNNATGREIHVCGAGSGLEHLSIDNCNVWVRDKDVTIQDCEIVSPRGEACIYLYPEYLGTYKVTTVTNLLVQRCRLEASGRGVVLDHGSGNRIRHNEFIGIYTDGFLGLDGSVLTNNEYTNGVEIRNSQKNVIEYNTFESDDYHNGVIISRMVLMAFSSDSMNVIQNNTGEWMGANDEVSPRDTNANESILVHGNVERVTGTVVSSTATSVTVNVDYTTLLAFAFTNADSTTLLISQQLLHLWMVSGPTTGQVKVATAVVNAGSGNTTFTVPKWQNVNPEVGDKVIIREVMSKNIIVDNDIDPIPDLTGVTTDYITQGVALWTNSDNCIIARNNIKHCLVGVSMYFSLTTAPWGHGQIDVYENTVGDTTPVGSLNPCGLALGTFGPYDSAADFQLCPSIVFRDNQISKVHSGAIFGLATSSHTAAATRGLTNVVVEANTFNQVSVNDIWEQSGCNWLFLRDNYHNVYNQGPYQQFVSQSYETLSLVNGVPNGTGIA